MVQLHISDDATSRTYSRLSRSLTCMSEMVFQGGFLLRTVLSFATHIPCKGHVVLELKHLFRTV